jgi:hypothetical protein
MTLRVVTAKSGRRSTFDWESLASSARFLTSHVAQWGRRVGSKHALLSLFSGDGDTLEHPSFVRTRSVGSRAHPSLSRLAVACVRGAWVASLSAAPFQGRCLEHSRAFAREGCAEVHRAEDRPRRAACRRGLPRRTCASGGSETPSTARPPPRHPRSRGCHALCLVLLESAERATATTPYSLRYSVPGPVMGALGAGSWATPRGHRSRIGFALRRMPLAVVCSWLGFQRAPCETPDSRLPPAEPSGDPCDLSVHRLCPAAAGVRWSSST